ncbi:ABC transporter substrate-binding protein [Bacillota bacterium Meth-B3]
MKKVLALILAVVICLGMTGAALAEAVEISFPNMWVGVNGATGWFNELKGEFDKLYEGKYKLVVEEIPGDQAYVDKIKVLYSSDSLPSAFNCGGYNLIDLMRDKLTDLTPYLDADPEWKAGISEVGLNVNSRDGKLYGIPQSKQVIGYFYNKALFEKAGISGPAATWDEFFAQCEQLKAAGITPVSMDTADSGWVTSLMLGAMIGTSDAGEAFMNTLQPTDYNTPEFIEAAGNIQKLFMNYTTSDAVGGKYEHAAANFYAGKTAMIANGPWMISSFYDASMAPEGFADQVGVAAYPGNVMYNSGKIGFNVGAKSPEGIEAALAFVKFFTSPHAQQRALEMTGEIPDNPAVVSDEVYPLVNETIKLGANAGRSINDFQSLWFANVVDEVSVQYPMLAQNAITPEEFAQALTAAAQKNVD